ncbi:hypothetical protein [Pseudonocardia sp. DLS-67]
MDDLQRLGGAGRTGSGLDDVQPAASADRISAWSAPRSAQEVAVSIARLK